LVARDRGAPSRLLQMGPVVLSADVEPWSGVQTDVGRELVSERRDCAVERTVFGRDLLALWRARNQKRDRTIVPAHHEICGGTGRRDQGDRERLAGKSSQAPKRLGRPQRRRLYRL